MKKIKSKALLDESNRELMWAILTIFSNDLTSVQKRLLTEILVNKRSFNIVKNETGLTLPRLKAIFHDGVGVLNKGMYNLTNLRKEYFTLNEQHKKLTDKFNLVTKKEDQMSKFSPEIRERLNMPIEQTPFSHRVYNVCKSLKINHVSDLVKYSPRDFLSLRSFGKQSIIEVEKFLLTNGLYWGMLK